MIIDLNSSDNSSEEIKEKLLEIKDVCTQTQHRDVLFSHSKVRDIIKEINTICMSNKIIGIHFTRALKINIIKNGLLSRSGDEIREKFIKEFGHLFSSEQISEIKRRWSQYFWDGSDGRDFNVFFTFTDSALGSSSTEYLLDFYGGEQVSMCFDKDEDDEISTILQKIGEPLIVKCALNPSNITTYTECPWGMILVSTYHCEMNPLATRFVQEGSISVSVPPEDIVSIISLSNLDNLKTIDRN